MTPSPLAPVNENLKVEPPTFLDYSSAWKSPGRAFFTQRKPYKARELANEMKPNNTSAYFNTMYDKDILEDL